MTIKQKKILECLAKYPNGLKASEIAEKCKLTRREVNQFLYYEQTEYVNTGEPYYKWVKKTGNKSQSSYSTTANKKVDPVLSKLNNKNGAKVFTSRQFNALANWRICKTHSDRPAIGTYRTKTNNLIDYDSAPELKILKYLGECIKKDIHLGVVSFNFFKHPRLLTFSFHYPFLLNLLL